MSSLLICSSKFDGCGFVAFNEDWPDSLPDMPDFVPCPKCGEDHMFQVTRENIDSVTDDQNRKETHRLLDECELDEDLDVLEEIHGC